jgi:hypothetical protein
MGGVEHKDRFLKDLTAKYVQWLKLWVGEKQKSHRNGGFWGCLKRESHR